MRKTHIDNVRKLRSLNNCWICDGYREIKFIYQPKEPILDQQNHIVKIHLDFVIMVLFLKQKGQFVILWIINLFIIF